MNPARSPVFTLSQEHVGLPPAASLASHAPWMVAALAPMAQLLQDVALTPPGTVRWKNCMDTPAERGMRHSAIAAWLLDDFRQQESAAAWMTFASRKCGIPG